MHDSLRQLTYNVHTSLCSGISTVIPALGTFSREGNGLYSMESDRPGLLCRDVMSCPVLYNYKRGTSPVDAQSRDVPFAGKYNENVVSNQFP